MRIYVTRHGDRSGGGNHPRVDPPISELGRWQAEALGRRLRDAQGADARLQIISSPFRRTLQTAEIVAGRFGCSFRAEPALSELFHVTFNGMVNFRGLEPAEAAEEFPRLSNADRLQGKWWPDWPETQADCDRRVAEGLRLLLPSAQSTGVESVLLVGHGASCLSIMSYLAAGFSLAGHDCCGLSLVSLPGPAPPGKIEYHNDCSHLRGAPAP